MTFDIIMAEALEEEEGVGVRTHDMG